MTQTLQTTTEMTETVNTASDTDDKLHPNDSLHPAAVSDAASSGIAHSVHEIYSAHERAQRNYPWIALLTNELFAARILMIFITIFILILCISYAVGQVLSLVLDDYWCDLLSWPEVRQHSITMGAPHGVSDDCWVVGNDVVSVDKLWSRQSYGYIFDNQSASSIAKCFAFSLLSAAFIAITAYFVFKLVTDSIQYRKGQIKQRQTVPTYKSLPFISKFQSVSVFFKAQFGVDTGKWIISRIVSEIIEVLLQSQALLLYNGTSNDHNNVYLAYDSKFIILFSVFLFLNCISNAILWSLYAFKPVFCHGILFETILCSIDMVNDLFYALFPIIVVLSKQDDIGILVSLASLQTNDALSFWATFFPLLLLCSKCWSLSNQTMDEMRECYANQRTAPSARTNTVHLPVHSASWMISGSEAHIDTDNKHALKTCFYHIYTRKTLIMLISAVFCIYGSTVLALVTSHFEESTVFCNQIVSELSDYNNDNKSMLTLSAQQTLNERPELFLWNFCKQKVYPFDTKCDCRAFKFEYSRYDQHYFAWDAIELQETFNIELVDIISSVFRSFKMLQKMSVSGITDAYDSKQQYRSLNFTSDMFVATKLQVLEIEDLIIGYIAPEMSNWKDLQYLSVQNCDIEQFPNTFSQLSELQYVGFQNVNADKGYLPPICSFQKLAMLNLVTSGITEIPHCIKNIKALKIIRLNNLIDLKYIPLELLNMPHLTDFNVFRAFQLTRHSLMEYNNISDMEQFNDAFQYNHNANFSLQESGLCQSAISVNVSDTFASFIDETKSCVPVCSNSVNTISCTPQDWRDGICDQECRSLSCLYDGGDCHQLCECDNYWQFLGNGECDLLCNTSNCNFDEGDCITTTVFDAERCELDGNGCNVTWVNDHWCDSNCNNLECAFDGGDCEDPCGENEKCSALWDVFNFVANSDGKDNKISKSEICAAWFFIANDPNLRIENCTQFMSLYDINKDDLVSPYETLTGMGGYFDINQEKAAQIDCSSCLDNPEDYL